MQNGRRLKPCPHCKQFPFKYEEVQVYEIVRAVMFRREDNQ